MFSKRCAKRSSYLISLCKSIEEAKTILESTDLFDFSDYDTEYKFRNKLIQRNLYIEPRRPTMGYSTVENETGSLQNVEHHAIDNNLMFQLTKFLELEGVLDEIVGNQRNMSQVSEGEIQHFVNGESWKEIVERHSGKTVIPLYWYNDDFQVDNQVGSKKGKHSVSMFYFSIATLPPHLISKLESILVAMVAKTADIKTFGNYAPLNVLVHKLCDLETNGLKLFCGTQYEQTVCVVMVKVIGDNLGLHIMCGYKQGFNTKRPCITCEVQVEVLQKSWTVNPALIRTIEKYDNYFTEGTFYEYGLNESILNTLPSFHVTKNFVVDIMHDLQLGACQFILQKVLYYFTKVKRYFTIDILNNRIRNFNCGYKEDVNKTPKILEEHLTDKLHMHANESLFLIRYLPLIIYGKVAFDDPIYIFSLDSIDTIEACFANKFDQQSINDLKLKIEKNRQAYFNLFAPVMFKPKDHNMLHYPHIIEMNGPLKGLSTIRFEAKHQEVLAYTSVSNSRKNICYSICKKNGYEFAYFLLKGKDKYLQKIIIKKSKETHPNSGMATFMCNNNLKLDTYIFG